MSVLAGSYRAGWAKNVATGQVETGKVATGQSATVIVATGKAAWPGRPIEIVVGQSYIKLFYHIRQLATLGFFSFYVFLTFLSFPGPGAL
jgi:hypothetical protein